MLFRALILVITTNGFNAKHLTRNHELDPRSHKETAKLIHLLNKYYKDENGKHEELFHGEEDLFHGEEDLFHGEEDGDMNDTNNLRNSHTFNNLMRVIQKNYDAQENFEDLTRSDNNEVRIHVINNPEVLEEYNNNLKGKGLSSSSDLSSDTDDENKLKNVLLNIRRQAIFRLDDSRSRESKEFEPNTASKEYMTVTKRHQSIKESQSHKSKYNYNDDNADEDLTTRLTFDDFRNEEEVTTKNWIKDENSVKNNAWDVITKKYDWGDTEYKDRNDKSKENLDKHLSNDWHNEDTKTNFENKWSSKRNRDWDGKKWHRETKKTKNYETTERYENKENKFDKIETRNTFKKKAKANDRVQKLEKLRQNKLEDNIDWDQPVKKYTTRKERDFEKNSWEKKERWKQRTEETTNRWKKSNNEWTTRYFPKIPEYYKPKKQKRPERSGGLASFGRTPIPYVGKRGIYDDK